MQNDDLNTYEINADILHTVFLASKKKHLFLTGSRGRGKSSLLRALQTHLEAETLSSYAIVQKEVTLQCSLFPNETIQIGQYAKDAQVRCDHCSSNRFGNLMRPIVDSINTRAVAMLHALTLCSTPFVCIDEIGYLESDPTTTAPYQEALRNLLSRKQVLAALRKQDLPFINELRSRPDVLCIDLDQPFAHLGCVIMASGLGTRFGSNKLIAPFKDHPMTYYILKATDSSIFEQRVVVTRHDAVKELAKSMNIPVLLHNLPNRNDTIRLGIEALMQDSSKEIAKTGCLDDNTSDLAPLPSAIMFAPADQPLLSKATITMLCLLATALSNQKQAFIIRPSYHTTPGTPVFFSAAFFEQLKSLPPKSGGKHLIAANTDCLYEIPVEHEYELADIDDEETLNHLLTIL